MIKARITLLFGMSIFILLSGCSSKRSTPYYPDPDPANPTYGTLRITMATSAVGNQSPYVVKKPTYTLKGIYQDDHDVLDKDDKMVLSLVADYNDPRLVKKSYYFTWSVGEIVPYVLPFIYPTIDTLEGYKPNDIRLTLKSPRGQKSFALPRYPAGYELHTLKLSEVQKFIVAEPIKGDSDTYLPIKVWYPMLVADHNGKCQNPILELKPVKLSSWFEGYLRDDYDGKGGFTKQEIADIKAFVMNSPDMIVRVDMSDLGICLKEGVKGDKRESE
ncbi:hypothetical protein [Providencia alcalifaciens]|uniref:hypothetical protein n=1 Tax=Providencia alcalifaciens TaxID=126385 RepID=UPI0032DABF50